MRVLVECSHPLLQDTIHPLRPAMRLARTTRGTSAPPNLTAASIRLTYATITSPSSPLRSRRRTATQQHGSPNGNTRHPNPPERLGSPFAFHPFRREGTPSTVTSITETLHPINHPPNAARNAGGGGGGGGCAAYWLRSSRESEMEFQINSLRTTGDLRRLIDVGVREDNQWLLQRCHGILSQCLTVFVAGAVGDGLQGMDLGGLVQYAESMGFWNQNFLPGVPENGNFHELEQKLTSGMTDRYATPPAQIMHQYYR